MHKYGDIGMFKDKIAKQFNVNKDELFVCDIWKANIHREYRKRDSVADISKKNDDIFVYHSPKVSLNENENDNDEQDDNNGNDAQPEDRPADNQEQEQAQAQANEPELPQHDPVDDVAGGNEDGAGVAGGAGDVPAGEARAEEGRGGQAGQAERGRDGGNGDQGGQGGQGGQGRGDRDQGPRFQTFVVLFQRSVARQQYYYNQRQSEEAFMGYPLLVTFNLHDNLTMRQIRDRIWQLTKPFVADENIDVNDNNKPFVMQASWGYNNLQELTDNDEEFNLDERNMKFVIHFNDPQQYKNEFVLAENRPRDSSAPAPVDPRTGRSPDDGDDQYGRAITLEACIDAYVEEEILSQDDAWYCNKCKDFKCAKKKLDLWNSPDLLIIHLKRFSYTRQWRDRINTLVRFPIEGLDLSNYLIDPEAKKVATYDLYAISNHMGGLGGGHYVCCFFYFNFCYLSLISNFFYFFVLHFRLHMQRIFSIKNGIIWTIVEHHQFIM